VFSFYIYLGYNKLPYFIPHTLLVLPNPQNLHSYSNLGLQIPTGPNFINSHSLSHLDITDCIIRSLSVETFAKVSTLQSLELSYNNLNSAVINKFRTLPKLHTFYTEVNRLQCHCQLQEVWRWYEDHDIERSFGETAPSEMCHIHYLLYCTQQIYSFTFSIQLHCIVLYCTALH